MLIELRPDSYSIDAARAAPIETREARLSRLKQPLLGLQHKWYSVVADDHKQPEPRRHIHKGYCVETTLLFLALALSYICI